MCTSTTSLNYIKHNTSDPPFLHVAGVDHVLIPVFSQDKPRVGGLWVCCDDLCPAGSSSVIHPTFRFILGSATWCRDLCCGKKTQTINYTCKFDGTVCCLKTTNSSIKTNLRSGNRYIENQFFFFSLTLLPVLIMWFL